MHFKDITDVTIYNVFHFSQNQSTNQIINITLIVGLTSNMDNGITFAHAYRFILINQLI